MAPEESAASYALFRAELMAEDAKSAAAWLARLEKGVPKGASLAAMRSERSATSGSGLFQLSYQ